MQTTNISSIDPIYSHAATEKQRYTNYQNQFTFQPDRLVDVPMATEDDFAAIKELNHLVDTHSLDPVFWLALGETFSGHQMYPAALAAFEVAKDILLQPGFEDALDIYGNRLMAMLASTYQALGDKDKAGYYGQNMCA